MLCLKTATVYSVCVCVCVLVWVCLLDEVKKKNLQDTVTPARHIYQSLKTAADYSKPATKTGKTEGEGDW